MLTQLRRLLSPLSVYGEGVRGRGLKTLSSLDAYAQWASTYPPHAHNVLMEAEQAAMTSLFPPMSGKIVLDLACGTGRYGLLAQNAGFDVLTLERLREPSGKYTLFAFLRATGSKIALDR